MCCSPGQVSTKLRPKQTPGTCITPQQEGEEKRKNEEKRRAKNRYE